MSLYTKIKNIVLDTVFPIECVGCEKANVFLCDDCLSVIPIHIDQVCPVCEDHKTPHGQICFDCLGKSELDGLLVASSYRNRTLSKSIHLYKYRFIRKLNEPLSQLLLQIVRQSEIPLPDIICPVPLHPLRLRWRGFNQSDLLAKTLGKQLIPQLPIPLIHGGLIRTKFTQPQRSIEDTAERHTNIRNAFAWAASSLESAENIQGKYIWLIDDVATTSATLDECARILKQNGAKKVFGVVLAR